MAIPDEIPRGSIEFFTVEFDSPDDLTLGTVQIGLSPVPLVQPGSYQNAVWVAGAGNVARTSVPIDTSTLLTGYYRVWAKLTDSPEIVPRPYGTVRIV